MDAREMAQHAANAAPPVGVSATLYFGHSLNDWILIGTGLYLVCQFVVIAPKVWRTITGKKET